MEEIIRMQKNLLLIRRAVGWTAEEFGERIGVTRQTINNIESGRNKLTKTQYIAMRSVLDAEMIQFPDETDMLKVLLDVCMAIELCEIYRLNN
jgi:transcriptional regulator with XRE-family HTH domain